METEAESGPAAFPTQPCILSTSLRIQGKDITAPLVSYLSSAAGHGRLSGGCHAHSLTEI